jgi:hypothetical protein
MQKAHDTEGAMTRLPSGGPFLELNFFWADVPLDEAFSCLVRTLLSFGAVFRRGGVVVRRPHWGPASQASAEDVREVGILSIGDVEGYARNPEWALSAVYMERATATTSGVAEVVTRGTITREAALHDPCPLTIYTEGQWTDAWAHETKAGERQARTTGRRAKERFCALAASTRPSYASITVENTLPTPWALRQAPDGHAFGDFFVDTNFIGQANAEHLLRVYADAYSEPVGSGLYISTWKYFNPTGISILYAEKQQRSVQASRAIARAGR